jgi:hypothetical protein
VTDTSKVTRKWDLFFAARVKDINKALAKSVTIKKFVPPEDDFGGATISADIQSWKIVDQRPDFEVTNSVRTHVIFELSLKNLAVSGGLLQTGDASVLIPHARAYISMGLKFVRAHEDTATHHLVMDPPPPPDNDGHVAEFSWSIDKSDFKTPEEKSVILSLQAALGRWAVQHWDDLAHIFATLDIFDQERTQATHWMQPTSVDFSYAAANDPDDSVLCILAMTQGRVPNHNHDIVLPTALPANASAFVHIDGDLYLSSGIMPTLPNISPGASLDSFKYTPEDGIISLSKQPLYLPDVPMGHNAEAGTTDFPCPAQIDDISVRILGNEIVTKFKSRTTIRERYGSTFAQSGSGQSRTIYTDRNKYIVAVDQTRYMRAKVAKSDDGTAHVVIEVDASKNVDVKSRQAAGTTVWEKANSYILMGAEILTAIVIPPLGVIELVLSAAINFMENMIDKGNFLNDKTKLNGMAVPALLASINASWGGFEHLSATEAAIDNGLSIIGNLELSV